MKTSYRFPVYPVDSCPVEKSAWEGRSRILNCSNDLSYSNRYFCLPNSKLTSLVEFCYDTIRPMVQKDYCIVLSGTGTIDYWKCLNFTDGCPPDYYLSDTVYKYPMCLDINRRKSCFTASPGCNETHTLIDANSSLSTFLPNTTQTLDTGHSGNYAFVAIAVVITLLVVISLISAVYYMYTRRRLPHIWCFTKGQQSTRIDNPEEVEFLPKKDTASKGRMGKWTNVIESCKEILDNGQKLVCIGALGSGKSTILRQLADMFEEKWEILKFEDFKQFRDLNKKRKKKYIWILDDIFGNLSYINNESKIQDSIQDLEEIVGMCKKNRFRMILSIRQDILNLVAPKLPKGLPLDVTTCVSIDKLCSENNHFANEIQNKKCDRPNCCCQHVTTRAGNLGSALISNMLSTIKHTDLFLLDESTWDPLQALVRIFSNMLAEDEDTINRSSGHIMIYIMLKDEYNPEEFDKDCAKEIHENLNKTVINVIKKPVNTYITSLKDGGGRRRFKHEFYHIAAFHTCWKWRKELIIKFCSTHVIRQLCRIDHFSDLEIILDGEDLEAVNDRLKGEDLPGIERIADMPSASAKSQKS